MNLRQLEKRLRPLERAVAAAGDTRRRLGIRLDEWDTDADFRRKRRLLISLGRARARDDFLAMEYRTRDHTPREKRERNRPIGRRGRLAEWREPYDSLFRTDAEPFKMPGEAGRPLPAADGPDAGEARDAGPPAPLHPVSPPSSEPRESDTARGDAPTPAPPPSTSARPDLRSPVAAPLRRLAMTRAASASWRTGFHRRLEYPPLHNV
jgi:hypothetical protein